MRLIFCALLFTACQSTRVGHEWNKPEIVSLPSSLGYSKVFRELPLAASITKLPWTSDSWPTLYGGAAFRWQLAADEETDDADELKAFIKYPIGAPLDVAKLSPIEKLDVYLGNTDWELTRKERERTLEQKSTDGTPRADIPEWEGIMHAWAEAALQFEPIAPITLQGKNGQEIPFEVQDIYSLLSLFVHEQSPHPIVLASVCPDVQLGTQAGAYAFENEKQHLRRKHCGTLDAATFHTVLTNQIGKRNEGFIMDRDLSGQISNNPVVAYESRVIERPGENQSKKIQLRTVVFLTAETPIINYDEEEARYPYETESYEYELELDDQGKIVSGSWLNTPGANTRGSAVANAVIPDVLWKASPVWLNGPIKTVYEKARTSFAREKRPNQLRPLEDMPREERQALNGFFNLHRAQRTF